MTHRTRWINLHDNAIDWCAAEHPAPLLRKSFELEKLPAKAAVRFAAPGWADISINGKLITKDLMVPAVTQLDKHTGVCVYDVTGLLQTGQNVIGAVLGNGWFNPSTHEVWHFDKAPWRNYNRLFLELSADGKMIAVSDGSWKGCDGPVIFNQLRSGEHFDGRKIIPGWDMPDFDDSAWKNVCVVTPPPGLLLEDTAPQCQITECIKPADRYETKSGSIIYDFGKNLTGWCRIKVRGDEGAGVRLVYSELLASGGELDRSTIDCYILDGCVAQTDQYIHGASGSFTWNPRFVYHGFRYVEVITSGKITVEEIEACYIQSAFSANGRYQISHDIAAKLLECTRNSYCANFTGIPTDCPHREKNGWTGDTLLACETGLWLYDGAANYEHFIQLLADAQRLTGQLPGMVPTAGWGYNWGCGPVGDSVLFELPYQIWRFTGSLETAKKFYPNMKSYIRYALDMKNDEGLVTFGLGDWCHCYPERIVTTKLTSSAHLCRMLEIAGIFAAAFAPEDTETWEKEYETLKSSFIRVLRNADGTYAKDEMTANACALYFKLDESPALAAHLAEQVRSNDHKADFGIIGAKMVPRVLADHGYGKEAFKVYTQTAFPGWGNWIIRGATTLWERWDGTYSQTHIMFGDFTAWCFNYLAGIKCLAPGFSRVLISPLDVPEAGNYSFSYRTPHGKIRVSRKNDTISCSVPESIDCMIDLPPGLVLEN